MTSGFSTSTSSDRTPASTVPKQSDASPSARSANQPGRWWRRSGHVPGEPGVWILLFGDLCVFAVLFAIFLEHRGTQPELFAASQDHLNRAFGATNTLILLTSSLLIVYATRALRSKTLRPLAPSLTLGAMALGVCFVVSKGFEYSKMLDAGLTPSTNEFFTYYFVLTGLHLGHLVVGLGVLTILCTLARKAEPSATHLKFFEGGACFWHMVDLLWIVIFPLVFLVR
jgi:nitric oxide reductase NorE protein